jgi:hypothetical protein
MKAHAQISIGNAFLPENSVFRGPGGTLGTLVSKILPLLYLTASVLTAVYFILGAIQFIYSRGDAKAKETAKNKIQYAVLGFALATLSFLLVQFLGKIIPIGPSERGRWECSVPAVNATECQILCSECTWSPPGHPNKCCFWKYE